MMFKRNIEYIDALNISPMWAATNESVNHRLIHKIKNLEIPGDCVHGWCRIDLINILHMDDSVIIFSSQFWRREVLLTLFNHWKQGKNESDTYTLHTLYLDAQTECFLMGHIRTDKLHFSAGTSSRTNEALVHGTEPRFTAGHFSFEFRAFLVDPPTIETIVQILFQFFLKSQLISKNTDQKFSNSIHS